jgi:hypothetical protein
MLQLASLSCSVTQYASNLAYEQNWKQHAP